MIILSQNIPHQAPGEPSKIRPSAQSGSVPTRQLDANCLELFPAMPAKGNRTESVDRGSASLLSVTTQAKTADWPKPGPAVNVPLTIIVVSS